MKILRIAVVLAFSLVAMLGSASLASAAQPKQTPKQQQTLCIAKKSIALLKAIDKQIWRDKKARDAAIRAVPAAAKAACPLPDAPTPAGPYTREVTRTVAVGDRASGSLLCDPGDSYVIGSLSISATPDDENGPVGASERPDGRGVDYVLGNDDQTEAEGEVPRTFTVTIRCQPAAT